MARYTTAYSEFVHDLEEIHVLQRVAARFEKKSPMMKSVERDAICRGATVLLCSRLEAYVRRLGAVAIESMYEKKVPRTKFHDRFRYFVSRRSIERIRENRDPEKIARSVSAFLENESKVWSERGSLEGPIRSDVFSDGFSTPRFKRIRAYMNRFGYATYRADLEALLRGSYVVTINGIDHLVDTRNKIAHGDVGTTKTPADIHDLLLITKTFCRGTDRVFAAWWKQQFCSIR